jgi:cysteine synthase
MVSAPPSSRGANFVGAVRLAERRGPDAVVVTQAAGSGFGYLSVGPHADEQT